MYTIKQIILASGEGRKESKNKRKFQTKEFAQSNKSLWQAGRGGKKINKHKVQFQI